VATSCCESFGFLGLMAAADLERRHREI
jgi:hypothetical protein